MNEPRYPSPAGLRRTKLSESLLDENRVRQARLRAFTHERDDGGGESRSERCRVDRADMGRLESSEALRGQVVVAARLRRGEAPEETGERERVVAHGTDVMLGLPDTPRSMQARAWSA